MNKEILTIKSNQTMIKVQESKINAIRIKEIEKKAIRVIEDGKIGIAGSICNTDEATLLKQAKDNLKIGIEYPYELEKSKKEHRDYSKLKLSSEELLDMSEKLLEFLRNEYETLIFSNTIEKSAVTQSYENDLGLDLFYNDEFYNIGLLIKEEKSANLFDGFFMYYGREPRLEDLKLEAKSLLDAHLKEVELPKGRLPIFFIESPTQDFLVNHLNGEKYGTNSSRFSGRLNERLFNEKVNIALSFDSEKTLSPFFDHEGVTLQNDEKLLIENGVLKALFTDKKISKRYNLEHTGGASGSYDQTPKLAGAQLELKEDSKDIKKSLDNSLAALVVISSGGDFTTNGKYGAPVQLAYLFDGERLLGKLPEFSIRNDIFNMLGDDYIGTFRSPLKFSDLPLISGMYMDID